MGWKNEHESQISSGPSVNIHNSTFSGISGNIATIDDKTGTISGGTFGLKLSALKKSDSIQNIEKEQSLPSIQKSRKRKIKDLPEIKVYHYWDQGSDLNNNYN